MSGILKCPGRILLASGLFLLGSGWSVFPLEAQELPLKRNLPGTDSIVCPEVDLGARPSDEERAEASRLGSEANNEVILGSLERARDFLVRAIELDPLSPLLAYRLGRVHEDLGEVDPAITQFCRALALGSREEGIGDAEPRIEALARARQPQIPEEAQSDFLNGLLRADLGQLDGALEAFSAAFGSAPDWADPIYNRAIIHARLGNREAAVADFQEYLNLQPNAPDAILVSQRIGQLQTPPAAPISGGTAFGVGLLIPGMGQFYSGRALGGITVLSLAGGALAAGLLVEKVEVGCVGSTPSGDCPPDRIIPNTEKTTNPYLVPGLAVYAAVTVLGAIEAYFRVPEGGIRDGEMIGVDVGNARLSGPSLSASPTRLRLNLVRLTF
jgi:tetratricopeptide (TPR) repeat protein